MRKSPSLSEHLICETRESVGRFLALPFGGLPVRSCGLLSQLQSPPALDSSPLHSHTLFLTFIGFSPSVIEPRIVMWNSDPNLNNNYFNNYFHVPYQQPGMSDPDLSFYDFGVPYQQVGTLLPPARLRLRASYSKTTRWGTITLPR